LREVIADFQYQFTGSRVDIGRNLSIEIECDSITDESFHESFQPVGRFGLGVKVF